jgi:hypothetical protein
VCPRGHQLDDTGTFCVDFNNECAEGSSLGPGQCGCPPGFQLHLYFNQCVDKEGAHFISVDF